VELKCSIFWSGFTIVCNVHATIFIMFTQLSNIVLFHFLWYRGPVLRYIIVQNIHSVHMLVLILYQSRLWYLDMLLILAESLCLTLGID
jgi:hypothetical protein